MNSLEGKIAYITGGSKGIGLGVAKALLDKGMHVAITSRSQTSADQAAGMLNQLGKGEAIGIGSDVRNPEQEKAATEVCLKKFGKIDLVFANAGLGHFGSIEDLSFDQWNEVIDTNLKGVFHTLKSSLEALKQTEGYFMTLASLAGTNFFAGGSAYNASKFGLVGFTQAVMLDLRKYGIKTTTIMPGSVSTHFNNNEPSPDDAWKIQPEDIGQMVVDLLQMHPRTLPSKIEVRPTLPPSVQKA